MFLLPLLFSRFPTAFFIDSKQTKLFPSNFRYVSHFFTRKPLREKLFSLDVCGVLYKPQAPIKDGNFGAKPTHLRGFWLDVSFFSHVKKDRSRFLLDVPIFLKCENHRSLLWLARTNLRMKIYDIAFWWVFLSMY